ncbi:MAG: prepilin-type N-terminal cleavage/methylation domain-containing protein [Verrucomicrobiales bacterium]
MQRKEKLSMKRRGGFTLVELLVVIAVIAMIAAIAVQVVSGVPDRAKEQVARSNAQAIVTLYNSARSVDAAFTAGSTKEIADQLEIGVYGVTVPGTFFQMSDLTDEDRDRALGYLVWDQQADLLIYDPAGGVSVIDKWWGDWTPDWEPSGGDFPDPDYDEFFSPQGKTPHWAEGDPRGQQTADALSATFPSHTFTLENSVFDSERGQMQAIRFTPK